MLGDTLWKQVASPLKIKGRTEVGRAVPDPWRRMPLPGKVYSPQLQADHCRRDAVLGGSLILPRAAPRCPSVSPGRRPPGLGARRPPPVPVGAENVIRPSGEGRCILRPVVPHRATTVAHLVRPRVGSCVCAATTSPLIAKIELTHSIASIHSSCSQGRMRFRHPLAHCRLSPWQGEGFRPLGPSRSPGLRFRPPSFHHVH